MNVSLHMFINITLSVECRVQRERVHRICFIGERSKPIQIELHIRQEKYYRTNFVAFVIVGHF